MSKLKGTGACPGWLAWCAGMVATLVLAAPAHAAPGIPAANEVIGYAAADRSGATTAWTLAEGAPYLFVPNVGTEMAGAVAAVDTGAGVGAVLFQRPYFETRDTGCTPELGSDARPDLKWRGATARFSPPVEPRADGLAGTESDRFASLIIYRKDLGPPPGALFLNRRLTLGSPCRQAIHKTFFDRVFVPFAAPPEPARCYNLAGTHPQNGGKDIKVDFTSADRLVILQPADLDDRYRDIRHRFRVTLYDGDGCRGGAGEFRSAGQEPGDIKLAQVGLRDRVRSVRIVYEGGPLAPYYVVPTATPVAAKNPAPQPAPAAASTAANGPVANAPAKAAPAEATAAEAAPAEDKDIATPAPPSPPPSPPASPLPSQPPSQPATPPPSNTVAAVPTPSPDKLDDAATTPRPSATALLAALPAPRLELPAPKPATPAPRAANKTFEYPVHDIYRLNFCLRWGVDCGEPAATAWCKAQGFAKASAWKVDKDIGALFPTIVLADKRVCAQFPCDGFEEITCSN